MTQSIALFFGGQSSEHDISILSTRNIYKALSKEKYNLFLIKIEKNGEFSLVTENDLFSEIIYKDQFPRITFIRDGGKTFLMELKSLKRCEIEIALPVLHGAYGEDGKIQGFFETLHLPYVGCDTLASSVSMNKDMTKKIVAFYGIDVARFKVVHHISEVDVQQCVKELGLPIFVKPACEGSSYGVSKVSCADQLLEAVKFALKYDSTVLLEECIVGREVECGILGNKTIEASEVGEVVVADFYSYESKYENDSAQIVIPAKLSNEEREKIRAMAKKIYEILRCRGLSRVDFFLTENRLVFNEINTFPGFTNISMYPKLFEAVGVSYSVLLDRLIALALERC